MKKVLLTMACLLTSLSMVHAIAFTWEYNAEVTGSLTDPTGGNVGAGWVAELVEYDGGYASGLSGTVLATGATQVFVPGLVYNAGGLDSDIGNGPYDVYMRIYNASSAASASHYINLSVFGGGDYYTTASGDILVSDSALFAGGSGTTADTQANGAWIAIPEPGTIILFGLGSLVIAARRKFRK